MIEGGSIDHRTGKISTGRVKDSIAAFLAYMAPRVVEMHRVLKPSGVLFLQCDPEADSYLRLLLDAVFGRKLFINAITRRRAAAKGYPTRRLPTNSDTIFAYGKTARWKWNPSHEPYDMANIDDKTAQQYRKTDPDGRQYQLTSLIHPEGNRPNLTYELLGVTRVWRWTRERMEAEVAAGRVVQTRPGRSVPRFKRYLDEQPGRKRDDIWTDVIQPETSDSKWKTRKPMSLYRRLIECATDRGDVVLDPFCGCATTLVAAEQRGRQWVGIDIDPVAESETKNRLAGESGITLTAPVKLRKSLRRTDIPQMSDDKMKDILWKRQGYRCANPYCDSESLRRVDMDLDHRIPQVRGGEDDLPNRICLCGNCNSRKGRKAWGRFLDEARAVLAHGTVGSEARA